MPSHPVTFFILLFGSYLLGSLPFGLLVARAKGVDIRKVGSGNIGATNVLRSVGKPWGILVFVLDFLKGLAPVLLAQSFGEGYPGGLYCGFAAIAGHNWPVWLNFKGGKGVATSAGVLIGIAPWAAVAGLGVWLLLFLTSRIVSVASIGAGLGAVGGGWFFYHDRPLLAGFLTLLGALVILRHHANIRRLLKGEENRFTRKKEKELS